MPDIVPSVTLGGRSFAIAPLRLGRMKKLKPQLVAVMAGRNLAAGQMPDEHLLDAYQAIFVASACAADPLLTPAAIAEVVDNLEYFSGIAELAIASGAVLKLSFEDPDTGEASGPPGAMTSLPTASISTGSTA